MNNLRLLTWLDVQRFIREKTYDGTQIPSGITRIDCFSDALEVEIPSESSKADVDNLLRDWFLDRYKSDSDSDSIYLDFGEAELPVEFIVKEPRLRAVQRKFRPFWSNVIYRQQHLEGESQTQGLDDLTPLTAPQMVTFYSFKGGVGRTLHLAAYVFALLDAAKSQNKPITILVIDADLEAPGLTYWDQASHQPAFASFIDFLEIYHYSPVPKKEALDLFAKEVKKTAKREGKSTLYFLPAFLRQEQLLDTQVLPEHLARTGSWACSQAIHELGRHLGADYVFIDLRAGLSEIASPLLFDSRMQRFFVTTAARQSVEGLTLVLQQVSRLAPGSEEIDSGHFYDPSVLISFLTPELKQLPEFEEALIQFREAYAQAQTAEEDEFYSKRLEILETDFSQQLLYINTWDEARRKLAATSLMRVAEDWANNQIDAPKYDVSQSVSDGSKMFSVEAQLRRFKETCGQYEFAEDGKGDSLLVTEPLKNLAAHFQDDLPKVVSLGSKGAGKTFTYLQLARLKYWQNFVRTVLAFPEESGEEKTYIFPLLESDNLAQSAQEQTRKAREDFRTHLQAHVPGENSEILMSDLREKIKRFSRDDHDHLDWKYFWLKLIAEAFNLSIESPSISAINNFLKSYDIKVVMLFDGLEDVFQEAASNSNEQAAIHALINLPKQFEELRHSNLGLVIFLRYDYLKYTITQNTAQFENLYRAYELSWDLGSFLKLVYWMCAQAKVMDVSPEEIEGLSRKELEDKLETLWGKKLGKSTSNEAYTSNWVFAALTDFKGRLQARDIVRLLYHAAEISLSQSQEVQLQRWSSDRLLPPQAIRRALEPCSQKKVEEAEQEYPQFKEWRETIPKGSERVVPFTLEDFELEAGHLKLLEEMGVIYEHREKNGTVRYYMPEIFRKGLGFELNGGARPRVLALKRKALKSQL